jgi:Enoyl-CoA hydratase/isomerase
VSPDEFAEIIGSPYVDNEIAGGLNGLIVNLGSASETAAARIDPGSLPIVVVGIFPAGVTVPAAIRRACDVLVEEHDPFLELIVGRIDEHPIAATSLVVLLRNSTELSVDQGLAAESAVYSTLQSGAEFARFLAANRPPAPAADIEDAVIVERLGNTLRIELNRPHRHNAFSRSVRDGLSEALAVACLDDTIERVDISGRGPSFCSGGDLGEFGTFSDPAAAHRTRLTRSPARLIHRLHDRTTVHLHGACIGAGIELPAFADRITAAAGMSISLPEVALGLIPGAGGTVSLPRRIGRQRTAYLALGCQAITADTALRWGLIDEIS